MAILGTRYNNGMSNVNQNPCNCEPMCTTCGRPWVVCKGECGCKKSCCNNVNFCEYGKKVSGCLRSVEPSCPMQAVIPSVVVEDVTGLKNLADCFVHVTNINTTFYIDDKHRTMVTWAGPVEYDNYDLDANTLGLRSQFLIDNANEYAAYYNKTGAYQKFNFSEDGADEPISVTLTSYSETASDWAWHSSMGAGLFHGPEDGWSVQHSVGGLIVPSPSFVNDKTGETLSTNDVYDLLNSGKEIVLNGVPHIYLFSRSGSDTINFMGVHNNISNFSSASMDAISDLEIPAIREYSATFMEKFSVHVQGFTDTYDLPVGVKFYKSEGDSTCYMVVPAFSVLRTRLN